MTRNSVIRLSVTTIVAAMLALVAVLAFAQLTCVVRGTVTDEAGNPVEGAEVKGEFLNDIVREFVLKTDKKGQFLRAGVPPGAWKISASKDGLVGVEPRVQVDLGDATVVKLKLGAPKSAAPAGMSSKQIEENNKQQTAMEANFNAAKTAFDAGDYDGAIANLNKMIVAAPTCAACYLSVGDAYIKKNDLDGAEKAYLKSIELDATKPAPYSALANIYNSQKKFDEAGKMGAKANALSEASGGGGDASSTYNQGVILWNQSKPADAEVQFDKATKLDPKMADAFYWLGMARVSQGKMAPAKAPFEEYLKLAPTGQYADQVKQLLAVIK